MTSIVFVGIDGKPILVNANRILFAYPDMRQEPTAAGEPAGVQVTTLVLDTETTAAVNYPERTIETRRPVTITVADTFADVVMALGAKPVKPVKTVPKR